jgi:hypothetical protein
MRFKGSTHHGGLELSLRFSKLSALYEKYKIRTRPEPSMTDTPGVSRGAGKDAQWLSDRATKRGLLARLAGLKTKGHRVTFSFGAG